MATPVATSQYRAEGTGQPGDQMALYTSTYWGVIELALSACHTPRAHRRMASSTCRLKLMRRAGSGMSLRKAVMA